MAKLVFFAAVVVALVTLSTGQGYTVQQYCQCQVQESSLDACRQVVDHQLAVQLPFFHPHSSLQRSSQWRSGVRAQCCQQLRGVTHECRAAAIRQIVRHYEHQAVAPLRERSYYPGEDEEQQEGGLYYRGETYPGKQGGGFCGQLTPQQQLQGQGPYFGRQSQQTGFGGFSSPHRFGTEQQAARLRQLRVVARARQVAAQLPAMCRLQGRAFSAGQY